MDLQEIGRQAEQAVKELLEIAKPAKGGIFVIGCSSSEITGGKIGTCSSEEAAQAVFDAVHPVIRDAGLFLAAQCCEHLNRSLIVEREAAEKYGLEPVNVVPFPKAGGSFATAAYHGFTSPCAVETVTAVCGMDIGDTLIGMHLKKVAVPVRLSLRKIGEANLVCARTRAKFVGGERAHYDETLL